MVYTALLGRDGLQLRDWGHKVLIYNETENTNKKINIIIDLADYKQTVEDAV